MDGEKVPLLPVIRPLSRPVTRVLARLPISANQITWTAMVFGLAACWAAAQATHGWSIAAGVLMTIAYILDNCDGDIARMKNQCSTFGMYLDGFVDWLVHTVFFWALGYGLTQATGQPYWNWMGLAAAGGGTINYGLSLTLGALDRAAKKTADPAAGAPAEPPHRPQNAWEWVLFALRELSRSDFCFIVLVLALFDGLWVLLPMGAIGAQVYWMTAFFKRSREFHV